MQFDYSGFKTLLLAAALPPVPFLALAVWAGWRLSRQRRGGAGLLATAVLGIWLSSTDAAGALLSRATGLPKVLAPASLAALQGQRDGAILILGGGVRRVVPELGAGGPSSITAQRLAYGIWLARRTGWPLGFTGGIGWTATELKEPESAIISRVAAEDYGLPLRWVEGRSRDTRENAANALPVLAAAGVKQVILVTHDMHMRRALRAFEPEAARLGLRLIPAPVGLQDDGQSSFTDWCPSVSGYSRVRYVIYESLAWWAGR